MIKFYRYLFYINYRIGYNYYTSEGSSKTPEFQAVINLFTITNLYIMGLYLLINKHFLNNSFQFFYEFLLISVFIGLSLYFMFQKFEKKPRLNQIIREFKDYDEKHRMQGRIIWLLFNYISPLILIITCLFL